MLHFLESRVLHKFGILLHGRFIYSPHLLIRAIIYLYPYGLMNIYVMFWIIIQYYLFLCSKCFSFGHWGLFQLVLYLFDTPSLLCVCVCALCVCVCVQYLLTFWHYKMLQAYLVYFLPQSQNQPLLQESNIENQDLHAKYACCYWNVIVSRSPSLTERGKICV